MRFDESILHLPWYKLYLSYLQRATTKKVVAESMVFQLFLGGDNLSGRIPIEIVLLTQLKYLSLSTSKLTGLIPSELGILTQLTYVGLYRNELTDLSTDWTWCQGALRCRWLHPSKDGDVQNHYPYYIIQGGRHNHPQNLVHSFHSSAVMLIRNPAKAVPSYFNHLWESKDGKCWL